MLGRVLGPSKNAGNEMAQWILKSNGQIVPRRSLCLLKYEELHNNVVEDTNQSHFDQCIKERHGDSLIPLPSTKQEDIELLHHEDDEQPPLEMTKTDPVDNKGPVVFEQPYYDKLIHSEVILPQREKIINAKVLGRAKDLEGNSRGTFDENPMINTFLYATHSPDVGVKQCKADIIAESMYSQTDSEEYQHSILDAIIDYGTNVSALTRSNMYVVTKRGIRSVRKATVGWNILIKWKAGREQWIPLKEIKESNPIEGAEFSVSCGIENEPNFC